jgi:L-amino acid N-acyltransferase YncA
MTADDAESLLAFFRRVPEEERLYLKDDVTDSKVITRWSRELDYSRVLPLLACDANEIVGDGTLHRSRADARRHVGEVRIVIDPQHRNRGVGRTLLQALVDVARREDDQLEKLVFEVVGDTEQAAAHTAEALGFSRVATFAAHVRYYRGEPHDLHVYERQIGDVVTLDDPASHMF